MIIIFCMTQLFVMFFSKLMLKVDQSDNNYNNTLIGTITVHSARKQFHYRPPSLYMTVTLTSCDVCSDYDNIIIIMIMCNIVEVDSNGHVHI